MQGHLCITVRFLDGAFHGRADRGEPEWPPSPLRLFQALVAAAAAHWNERGGILRAAPVLRWLEGQPAPLVVAPHAVLGSVYRLYVPDNVADIVARSWVKGNEASIAEYRSEKDVRPMRLAGGDAVHYLWPLPDAGDEFASVREVLFATVSSITHLGWGVDMVTAHAATLSGEEASALPGQRWLPSPESGGALLRVPVPGTLADLESKHAAFLARTRNDRFAPVPPLSRFKLMAYADDSTPTPAPTAAFSLLRPDASGYRVHDPVPGAMRVAAMLRHAASDASVTAALGWDEEKMRRVVLGHGEAESAGNAGSPHVPVNGPRIAFLPLPSLFGSKVGDIRRVLLMGVRGQDRRELLALARLLSGQTLERETTNGQSKHDAILSQLPNSDRQIARYTQRSAVWTTVTPVILPGHDDRDGCRKQLFARDGVEGQLPPLTPERQQKLLAKLDARTDALLRKAIRQADFSESLAAHAEIEWRNPGFYPGTALASAYDVPQKLRRFRRLHVRIVWRDAGGQPVEVAGPVCLGGGRFAGLGVFCAVKE